MGRLALAGGGGHHGGGGHWHGRGPLGPGWMGPAWYGQYDPGVQIFTVDEAGRLCRHLDEIGGQS